MSAESLAFKEWARAEGLVLSGDVAEFDGATIGFDAEDYLNSLLNNVSTREPLLPALGGLPFALQQHVDSDLSSLEDAGIKSIFMFNGLDIACHDRKSIMRESQKATKTLNEAWSVYDQGRGDDAVVAFGRACTYRTSHILRYLFHYLHQKGVHVQVAPYNAAAQLVYLDQEGYISACYGSASCLVFGADKVVTSFDWESKKASWIELSQVLNKLMFKQHQFVDLCLLSGSSILATMPEIDIDALIPKMVAARTVLNRANQDGHLACLQSKDEEYLALFRKAKFAVKHMVVLHENGEIKQLDFENAPSDTHEFINTRLPEELMAYHAHGLIGSRILNWRTRQEILETPPLDGGTSKAYQDLVQDKLRPLRARSLTVLTNRLHRYFHKQDVNLVCWFNESNKKALGIKDPSQDTITKDAESWHVRDSLANQSAEAKSIKLNQSPIQYAIAVLSDDALAKKTVTPRKEGEHSVISKPSELLSNTMWRFLQDRGYINSNHTLSAWGKALKAAFDHASSDKYLGATNPPNEAEESIFVAFELLRLDLLNAKQFPIPPYSGAPLRGTEADKAHTLLISRIACLATFEHEQIGYTGPLSRNLLAFQQLAAAVRDSLRDLVEVHACNMMLSGSAVRIRDTSDYTDVGGRLPFGKEPDIGLALVVKSHLDELSNTPDRRSDIKRWFNHAHNIDADLQKAWTLWDAINAGIQAADSAIVNSETKNLFQNTDTWLQKKRQEADSPVPVQNGES
ncbi:xpg i-region protein [Zymoseptoria brevis]|uniref:Xpg i-region protein n=1 Tax=Zymoseptoria brevis TaxID=1047168 RepID=A0A0F4GDX4_9PEZI|nr:xpg i-region protein [Zymoseptoria brevis]